MTDELSPEREERLIVEVLRERGAIDPGRLGPVIDLAALGLVTSGGGTRALRAGTPRAVCTTAT
jgi:hypothetical protein